MSPLIDMAASRALVLRTPCQVKKGHQVDPPRPEGEWASGSGKTYRRLVARLA
jgi:hypothetical protein